eukprot:sb/3470661/
MYVPEVSVGPKYLITMVPLLEYCGTFGYTVWSVVCPHKVLLTILKNIRKAQFNEITYHVEDCLEGSSLAGLYGVISTCRNLAPWGTFIILLILRNIIRQEQTETSKQPIRTRYLGHVTGYQPIRRQYSLIRSVPDILDTEYGKLQKGSLEPKLSVSVEVPEKFQIQSDPDFPGLDLPGKPLSPDEYMYITTYHDTVIPYP